MLKVSRRSWHYRLWKFGHPNRNDPKNLCRYFWFCVFMCAWPLALGSLALIGVGALVYVVANNLYVTGVGVGFVVAFAAGVLALVKLIQWQGHRLVSGVSYGFSSTGAAFSHVKHKEPGLLRSFIRAKKQKVCPMIQVVD